ncbi:hypothetical protein [Paracidovorax oryzae]|uniref:hypothetical protein n=1 Tax=Paracidovorax oryzae TaxID=862720 RepID=UPI00047C6E63|nr:hypothetical protein [Paracidovorax oryzae]
MDALLRRCVCTARLARRKASRLRHLRDLGVVQARKLLGVQVLKPEEPGVSGGITALWMPGMTTAA